MITVNSEQQPPLFASAGKSGACRLSIKFFIAFSLIVAVLLVADAWAFQTNRDSEVGTSQEDEDGNRVALKQRDLTVWGNIGVGVEADASSDEIKGQVKAIAFLYSSDRELKENIHSLEQALDKVTQLRGVTYYWRDPSAGKEQQIGLIAQEVEAVYPQLVRTDSNGLKSVQYGNLVAILIEAVKQQQRQIEQQQDQIDQLKQAVAGNAE